MKKKESKNRKIKKYSVSLELSKVDWTKVEKIFSVEKMLMLDKYRNKKIGKGHTKDILKLLAGGAVFCMSLAVPVLPSVLAPFLIDGKQYGRTHFHRNLKRLEDQKLVKVIYEGEQTRVVITDKGKVRALRYKLGEMTIIKPKVWDRKWRVVIFDIPEKYKGMREVFRHHLQTLGFFMLQKSVWVHPYSCFDEIEFLRSLYGVGIDATYMVAEKVENSQSLKEHFKLR